MNNLTIKKGSENYVATVVEVKELYPIPDAQKIQRCVIFGNNVVVSKDIKIGDVLLYFVSGTRLNEEYCKRNNLLDKAELNADVTKKGFISYKQLRIKAIRLKGIVSDGLLLPLESLLHFCDIKQFKIGDTFTCINGNTLCEKYFVPIRNANPGGKAPKQPTKISRLIDGQFYLHGGTENLRRNMDKINPDDIIGIHYKKHGTSVVISNCLVKKELKWYEKFLQRLGIDVVSAVYDIIYSSRKVVMNQYLNPESKKGFYSSDIWGDVAKEVSKKIPKNWTLYGEILGYTKEGGAIQGKYDYGCQVGEHKFYVYKISIVNEDGKVIYLTDKQIEEYCEQVGLLYKDTLIYYGKAKDLYYNTAHHLKNNDNKWREEFLQFLEQMYNEGNCYMCVNKVPEEGIVLRVEKLESYEAYKLKSKRFVLLESDLQEKEEPNIEDNQ